MEDATLVQPQFSKSEQIMNELDQTRTHKIVSSNKALYPRESIRVICEHCKFQGYTATKKSLSLLQLVFVVLFLLICFLPCMLLPCFLCRGVTKHSC